MHAQRSSYIHHQLFKYSRILPRHWENKFATGSRRRVAHFETRELPKEESAQYHRRAAAASKPNPSTKGKLTASAPERGTTRGRGQWRGRGRPSGPLKARAAAGLSKAPKTSTSKEKSSSSTLGPSSKGKNNAQASTGKLRRNFNMYMFKLHALGDYVATIARHGTTDNYSTQIVSHLID